MEEPRTMATCPSLPLSVQSLDESLNDLEHWERMAIHLPEMSQPMIDVIKLENQGNIAKQKLALYDRWLEAFPHATWSNVVDALETAEEMRLAVRIQLKVYRAIIASQSSQPKDPVVIFEKVEESVVTTLQRLSKSFKRIEDDVEDRCDHLVNSGSIKVDKLLRSVHRSQASSKVKNLQGIQSVSQFFEAVRLHYTFLDCDLLEDISEDLPDSADVYSKVREHKINIQCFKQLTPIRALQSKLKPLVKQAHLEEISLKVYFELEEAWGGSDLKRFEVFLETMFPELSTKMKWYKIVPGSICITLDTDRDDEDTLVLMGKEKQGFLRILGVISLYINGKKVFIKTESSFFSFESALLDASLNANTEALLFLLNVIQVSVDHQDKDGKTALDIAVDNNHIKIAQIMLDAEANPNHQRDDGNTPLHIACYKGYTQLALMLIKYGANPSIPNTKGDTPFLSSIRDEMTEDVMTMIPPKPFQFELVKVAFHEGNEDLFRSSMDHSYKLLLNKFDHSERFWESAANSALSNWDKEWNKDELRRNAEKDRNTILHRSCFNKWYDVSIRLLEEFGLDPNVQDSDGNTALHCACTRSNGNVKLAMKLISSYKCDPLLPDINGDTPLHYAIKAENSAMVQSIVEFCRHGSLDIKHMSDSIMTTAWQHWKNDIIKCLINEGECSLGIKNGSTTILHQCVIGKYTDRLRFVLDECHCDVNVRDKNGDTILHKCASLDLSELFKDLVSKYNCKPDIENNKGETPLHIICSSIVEQGYTKDKGQIFYYLLMDAKVSPHIKFSNSDISVLSAVYKTLCKLIENSCNYAEPLILRSLTIDRRCDPSNDSDLMDLLHKLVTKFGFEVNKTSHDSLVNATIKDICQNTDVDYTICLQNPLHSARVIICCLMSPYSSSIYSLFYDLINSSELNLMSKADIFGNTLLHLACLFYHGDSTLIEYLLSTGKTDPLCVNDYQQTPLTLLAVSSKATKNELNIQELIGKFGETKVSHPIESYVNIIILGNPGVGKSTLVKVIKDRHNAGWFAQFRSVTGVELCTAGIVPHVLNDKEIGRIIVHDLAGQVEYYSSHTAVIGNLLQGSAGVFVIVVSLADEKSTESLKFWLSIVENASLKSFKLNHVFVVVSHSDTNVTNKVFNLKESGSMLMKLKSSDDLICHTDIFSLDCRKLGGGQLDSLMSSLSGACESVRRDNVREMSVYCHMLYDFLLSHDKAVYSLNQLVEAIKGKTDCYLPTGTNELFDIIQSLSSTGLIMFCLGSKIDSNNNNNLLENMVWIISDKSVLLKNLNGVLFAPEYFKEHVDKLVKKTGIVKLSELSHHCSQHDPDMIVQFLESMELCHEISKKFILSSNLAPSLENNVVNDRYLFIPALIENTNRPDDMQFQFGWCLQCSNVHSFFLSQFIHLIIIHVLGKFTEKTSTDEPINRHCHIWNNGIYWNTRYGVSTLVEVFDKQKYCVLLMSFKSDYYDQMSQLRKAVIGEILSCKNQVLPKASTEEFIIDNTDLQYPQILDRISTVPKYSTHEFCECLISGGKPCVLPYGDRNRVAKEINALLQGTDIKEQCESVLAGRNPKNLSEKVSGAVDESDINRLSNRSTSDGIPWTLPVYVQGEGPPVYPPTTEEPPSVINVHYSVLLKYKPQLLGIIGYPEVLAVELVSQDLLSQHTQDHVRTAPMSRFDKANMIIDEIVRYFENHINDSEGFLKFCQVLKDHDQPGLDRLAKEMEQQAAVELSEQTVL